MNDAQCCAVCRHLQLCAKCRATDFFVLVNRTHPLPPDAPPPPLVRACEVVGPACAYERPDIQLHPRAAEALAALLEQAKRQGMRGFLLVSGYRDYAAQAALFAKKRAACPDYGDHPEVAVAVAHPCASEHRTGLAMDLVSLDHPMLEQTFAGTSHAAWLAACAPAYGWILRYPAGKEARTGVVFEPWHYRYVGEAAGEISRRGLCFEEFLQGRAQG